jgi:hypothetical protein
MLPGLLLLWSLGCTPEPVEVPKTLSTVSNEITFASVATLGPHFSVASITQTDTWENGETVIESETIELTWNNWNSFHFRRLVDGEMAYEAVVHDGVQADRNGQGPWQPEADGETARLDVRTSWNAWDQALETFRNRVIYADFGPSVVDGRPTRRYRVSLDPDRPKRKGSRRTMAPISLGGEVFVDEGTAVRLAATINAEAQQGARNRRIRLHIRRSKIGEILPIEKPILPTLKPSDALRKLPKNPRRPQ